MGAGLCRYPFVPLTDSEIQEVLECWPSATPEKLAELRAEFDEMDTNKDGILDQEDAKDAISAAGLAAILRLADLTGDGRMSFAEFGLCTLAMEDPEIARASLRLRCRKFFLEADKDRDGKLNKKELREALRLAQHELSEGEIERRIALVFEAPPLVSVLMKDTLSTKKIVEGKRQHELDREEEERRAQELLDKHGKQLAAALRRGVRPYRPYRGKLTLHEFEDFMLLPPGKPKAQDA